MATIGLAYFLEGLGDVMWGSDIKKLDGEAEEKEGEGEEEKPNLNDQTEEIGGGGFADTTDIGAAD